MVNDVCVTVSTNIRYDDKKVLCSVVNLYIILCQADAVNYYS